MTENLSHKDSSMCDNCNWAIGERKRKGAIALSYPAGLGLRATVKLPAAFFHDELSIRAIDNKRMGGRGGGREGGYESAIAANQTGGARLRT